MKQIVILSGKGGTGKTSISAAFAFLASQSKSSFPPVIVDADVDAANLSLVLQPERMEPNEFWGGSLAFIDSNLCTGCGQCVSVCRYDAIQSDPEHYPAFLIDPIACDGCAACVYACPQNAIEMVTQLEGNWFHSPTPYGQLFHAELFPGRENSGKLVTLIKQHARLWADDNHLPLVIIDGPPGIGCPVISACAGTDLGLVVTEPGQAGLHDLKRILKTLQHFRIPAVIIINKADIYPQGTVQIREFAAEKGIEIVGEIPFDERIPNAMFLGVPINEKFPESSVAQTIRKTWEQVIKKIFE